MDGEQVTSAGPIQDQNAAGAAERLEQMAKAAEAENQTNEEAVEGSPVEVMPVEEAARIKARAIIGTLKGATEAYEPRIEWPEDIYSQGEEHLAPAMAKHSLAESMALQYVEEINAGFFLAGLAMGTVKQIKELRAADAAEEAAKRAAAKQGAAQPVEAPETGPAINQPPMVVGG